MHSWSTADLPFLEGSLVSPTEFKEYDFNLFNSIVVKIVYPMQNSDIPQKLLQGVCLLFLQMGQIIQMAKSLGIISFIQRG